MFDLYRAENLIEQTEILLKLNTKKPMINLNKEAKDYAIKECGDLYNVSLYHNKMYTYGSASVKNFIAGHNSKTTEVKVIQAQINENNSVLEMLKIHGNERCIFIVKNRIKNLQQQLKKLENETNN